jgi:hypothetical protein
MTLLIFTGTLHVPRSMLSRSPSREYRPSNRIPTSATYGNRYLVLSSTTLMGEKALRQAERPHAAE